MAAWRRRVLVAESQVAVCASIVRQLETKMASESERLKVALQELAELERARFVGVCYSV